MTAGGRDAFPKRGKLSVECVDWRPLSKGTLLGFAQIRIPEIALVIHDVALHRKNESVWVQLPARPQIVGGALVTNDNGKIQYATLLEFGGRAVADAFSRAFVDAVIRYAPDAFDLRKGAA